MQKMLFVREPTAAELHRAAYLFRNTKLPGDVNFLLVVRTEPVERFIGAVAWWPEGPVARFHLACQPGVSLSSVAEPLLDQLSGKARTSGLQAIENVGLLNNDPQTLQLLQAQGFEITRSERFFEIAYRDAWSRVMELYTRHQKQIPITWRTEPIRLHHPEVVMEVVSPHRLMPPAEISRLWLSTARPCFDPELSCVLFDGTRPFGAFLSRRMDDTLAIDVQVVHEPNRRLRSLADIFLLYHDAVRIAPGGTIARIQFRSGEMEHRQTANLALRMGGRELARGHVVVKKLGGNSP